MSKHLWAALPSCLLFLAMTAAEAASAPTIVAAESGSSTLVAGVIAPDFVSCRNSIGDSTAFVLEESTAALWLVDNSTKTAARVSAEALKELQGSRVEAINKQQALLAQVEKDPHTGAWYKAKTQDLQPVSVARIPEAVRLGATPASAASALPEFERLESTLASMRDTVRDTTWTTKLLAATFSCLIDLRRVPVSVSDPENSRRTLTFTARPGVRVEANWRRYTEVPLSRFLPSSQAVSKE